MAGAFMRAMIRWAVICTCVLAAHTASAHGVGEDDQAFLTTSSGTRVIAFMYLGAKHMVTGLDHLLFLLGVIFFLYRMKEVALYVTLFAIGHSVTLLWGVLGGIQANPWAVDALIGLSVVYKAFDNLDGFRTLGLPQPNQKAAVLLFGFVHGFGLATKMQDLALAPEGLVTNMIAFNIGVELGQFLALAFILLAMNLWRRTRSFDRYAYVTNVLLMSGGFLLFGYQFTGYVIAST
jgi:hypothetical protein